MKRQKEVSDTKVIFHGFTVTVPDSFPGLSLNTVDLSKTCSPCFAVTIRTTCLRTVWKHEPKSRTELGGVSRLAFVS